MESETSTSHDLLVFNGCKYTYNTLQFQIIKNLIN